MKIAVSIPHEVLESAERVSRRTRKSRSKLFSEAIKEYVARHAPEEVTEVMNRALAGLENPTDQFVSKAAKRVLCPSRGVIFQGEIRSN